MNERSLVGFIRPETFAIAGGFVAVIFVGYLFVFLTGGISDMRYSPSEEGTAVFDVPVAVPGAGYEDDDYGGRGGDVGFPGPIV